MPLPRPPRRRELAKALIDDGREHREVAAAAGFNQPGYFSGIVSGRIRTPRPETRARIAEALHRPECELFPEFYDEVVSA